MKTFKQIREQTINRIFGNFIRDEDGRVDYDLSSIPEEDWLFFVAVLELMRGGLEYQEVLGRAREKAEANLKEDINKFYSRLRTEYRSGRRYNFKEWISVVRDMIDELD